MGHDRSHEPLLRAALLGELRDGDPRLAELSACAVCRGELSELKAVTTALDAASGVDEGPKPGDAADEAATLAALTRLSQEEPYGAKAAGRPPRLGLWVLAAAAAAALASLALRGLWNDDRGEQPQFIGDEDKPVLEAPRGEVDRYDAFRWSYDLDHRARFNLRIYPADAPADALPLITVEDWRETTWRPNDEQRALLPSRIEWEVDALDAHGEVAHTSFSSRAWLRSH